MHVAAVVHMNSSPKNLVRGDRTGSYPIQDRLLPDMHPVVCWDRDERMGKASRSALTPADERRREYERR